MWQWNDGTCELYHYGVKGMKWGVRKARPQGDTTGMVRRKQKKAEINKTSKTTVRNTILQVRKATMLMLFGRMLRLSIMPLAAIVLSVFSQRFRTNLRRQRSTTPLSIRRALHLIAPMLHGQKPKRHMPRPERMLFQE